MSHNSNIRRKKRAVEEARQGEKVVKWILWALLLLAFIIAVWTMTVA